MKASHQIKVCLAAKDIRSGHLHGRPHVIVPAILLVEGIHAGSQGPLFYGSEVLSRHAAGWAGRSITIDHPQELGGGYVSVSATPQIYERSTIGTIFDSRFEDGKLKADLWLDVTKTPDDVLSKIRAGQKMEISTGLFSTDIHSPGHWNGEAYETYVAEIVPDHCAILPYSVGACSLEKGCGIRSNVCEYNKNTNLEEITMEEAYVTDGFFWDCPVDVQRRIRAHFAANHGPEITETKLHRMTKSEAIELDRSLRGCAGASGSCGGCGTCGSPQVVNESAEEEAYVCPSLDDEVK